MAVTIERNHEFGIAAWDVTRHCQSQAEAMEAARLLDSIDASAFLPTMLDEIEATHHAFMALLDGHPATGGGESSQTLLTAGEFVELAPEAAALIEMSDEDAPVAGLKAGEAYRDEEE